MENLLRGREGVDFQSFFCLNSNIHLVFHRNIRSSVESSQQEITGRFVLEVDSIRDSVKRYSETLSKVR